jgi:carbon storage regulator CsrA
MLVLSRRVHEKILFPSLQTSVQVLGVKGNAVRLGVTAPPEVAVLRGELQDLRAEKAGPAPTSSDLKAERERLIRMVCTRLQVSGVGLEVLRAQLQAEQAEDALTVVERLTEDLQLLHRRLTAEARKSPAQPPRLRGPARRALLVEDNANERELLARFLRMSGFEVDTAGDGADALDYLRSRERPDVLLLDMGLPRCDGPTTIRAIRRDEGLASLKIVAVSGSTPEEWGLGSGPSGFDRWCRKPVDPSALIRDLEGELDRVASS